MSTLCFADGSGNIVSYENINDVSLYFTCPESYNNVIMWCKCIDEVESSEVTTFQLFTIQLLSESYLEETVRDVLIDLKDKKSYYYSILNEKEIDILHKIYGNFDFYRVRYEHLDFE